MNVQNEAEIESSKSNVTNLNFFDFVESETTTNTSTSRPNDEEEGISGKDGSVHRPDLDFPSQTGYDEQHTAIPICENTLCKGNVGSNQEVSIFEKCASRSNRGS
ncbi:hypothetical protein Tco_0116861 [Tanacetum coccineum]